MTITDAAVILFGLFAGYWVVSKLFFGGSKGVDASSPTVPTSPPTSPTIASPDPSIVPPAPPIASLDAGRRWYEILEVLPTAGDAEIRDAYQRLVSLYHPDKVDSLGQELKDLALRKMQQITAAYREAMHARGTSP